MKTDPRIACANERELFWWAILHDLVAHPLMALTFYSALSLRFHDWTSKHAWPRDENPQSNIVTRLPAPVLETKVWSPFKKKNVRVSVHPTTMEGFWSIDFSHRHHTLVVKAETAIDAVNDGAGWLYELEIGD